VRRMENALGILAATLLLSVVPFLRALQATDTLPSQLPDAAYWKMIADFSEPDATTMFAEWLTSNEAAYQNPLPQLTKSVAPGGVYLGVGPEQNFTYIAAARPKIAFIIDIRREIMLEHLMYKALFEISADPAEFVSKLFSRKRPSSLTADSSVQDIFQSYAAVTADSEFAEGNLKAILARLKTTRAFALSTEDEQRIRAIHRAFFSFGLRISAEGPDYHQLMLRTDADGKNWNFLASRENYDRIRAMHGKNLIVPLVGDFAGPKALRMVGQYLRDHGAVVNVFYVSNVENFLRPTWTRWTQNVASLPINEASVFIRWSLGTGAPNWLASIPEFVRTGDIQRP
jgi:hypothetical protein